jgi:hypothetical protein
MPLSDASGADSGVSSSGARRAFVDREWRKQMKTKTNVKAGSVSFSYGGVVWNYKQQ